MKQALIGILALSLAYGMYSVASRQQTNKVPAAQEMSSSTSAATEDAEVEVIAIEAGSFYYKPNVIEVTKGQKVKIISAIFLPPCSHFMGPYGPFLSFEKK